MGMWTNITVHIETASKEQMNAIREMDIQNQGWGKAPEFQKNVLEWKESLRSFDSEAFLESISDLLDKHGYAYVIEDREEDIPECTTYYYLGDGVKSITFTSSKGKKSSLNRHKSLSHATEKTFKPAFDALDDWDLLRIYIDQGYYSIAYSDSMEKIADKVAEAIFDTLCQTDYRDLGELLDILSPELCSLIQPLFEKNLCRYEDHDFAPNLSWEHKKIARFTEDERNRLKGLIDKEVSPQNAKPLPRSKRLVKNHIFSLISKEGIAIESKIFVVDGDKTGTLAAKISSAGGIVEKKIKKKTDYLVINNNGEECSASKFGDYCNWKKKGSNIQLITFDAINDIV